MAQEPVKTCDDGRGKIALIVLAFALAAVAMLGITALVRTKEVEGILASLLPMLSAWVGTILAFYFGRENFESAARSAESLAVRLTSDEKLRTIQAGTAMIPIGSAASFTLPAGGPSAVLLERDLLKGCFIAQKRNRLPILDANGCLAYIAHRSLVDRFIVETIAQTQKAAASLTLADMLGDAAYLRILQDAAGTVRETSTLADAKALIDRVPDCLDVFVTEDGSRRTRVIGWLTNVVILEHARV